MISSGRFGAFDLETTGVDTETARIVSACVVIVDEDGTVVSRWDWLADPGIEIPASAAAVHGITTERARSEGRAARSVVGEIVQSLRVLLAMRIPLVVYNAPYDLTLLDRECRRHGIASLENFSPVVDPLVIDKAIDRYRKGKRTLSATAAHYGVELNDAHDAGADAIAAARLARAIITAHPDELELDADDLHAKQTVWFAEQSARFQEYIRRMKDDPGFTAETEWPVRPALHPSSVLDTQPIATPLPRPSTRVPHLDFDTGTLVFDRTALEAPDAMSFDVVAPDIVVGDFVSRQSDDILDLDVLDEIEDDDAAFGASSWSEEDVESDDDRDDGIGAAAAIGIDDGSASDTDGVPSLQPVGEDNVLDFPVPVAGGLVSDPGDSEESDALDGQSDDLATAPKLRPTVLRVAAAIITNSEGETLLVRKHGTTGFMQAGGRIERGESAIKALSRELAEDLKLELDLDATEYLGSFGATAPNEPGTVIRAEVFAMTTSSDIEPGGRIEEIVWVTDDEPDGLELTPLTRGTILPLWVSRRAAKI